jgi:hypothetical protein
MVTEMKRTNQKGFIDTDALMGGFIILVILGVVGVIFLAIFSKWEWSEDNVSGIVYSTTNNGPIAGNTNFKVRASVDTYIDKDTNESAYCLPGNSPYKELVNKAAADKNIKVQVTTKKGFWFKAPWTCIDNVTVTEVK